MTIQTCERGRNTPAEPSPLLSADDFQRFRAFFGNRTGIMFGDSKRYFVDKRIATRMEALGVTSLPRYLDLCADGGSEGEFQNLVNAMTVNETYFNREDFQYRALVDAVLPAIAARGTRSEPIRIWSIPCSTGEEPYSLAIWMLMNWADVDRHRVEIVASDIDTDVLAAARRGHFGERSVQGLSPQTLNRYFRKHAPGVWAIRDELRNSVEFTRVNICSPSGTTYRDHFDVVFCRNMLIYFDDASREKTFASLHGALKPGGYCFLGHSDRFDGASTKFSCVRVQGTTAYRALK